MQDLLKKFPKIRPKLTEEVEAIHRTHYEKNRSGSTPMTSISQKLERWLHLKVAADCPKHKFNTDVSTLEIGAGNLNHLAYEPIIGEYDIVEPFSSLFQNKIELGRINSVYSDISEIPKEKTYDRIITTATLEHILNLPEVVAKSALHLKPNGAFRAAIPNEGTLLWNLAWKFTTGIEFKIKYGVNYGLIMAHEHVNTSAEVSAVLRHFYKEVKIHYFGPHAKLALYVFYECSDPDANICSSFLQDINSN